MAYPTGYTQALNTNQTPFPNLGIKGQAKDTAVFTSHSAYVSSGVTGNPKPFNKLLFGGFFDSEHTEEPVSPYDKSITEQEAEVTRLERLRDAQNPKQSKAEEKRYKQYKGQVLTAKAKLGQLRGSRTNWLAENSGTNRQNNQSGGKKNKVRHYRFNDSDTTSN